MKQRTRWSRRSFLKNAGVAAAGAAAGAAALPRALANASTPAAGRANGAAVAHRAPLAPNAFYLLPLGSIRPTGWLRTQMQTQAAGLSGHLGEVWADVGPNSGWLGGTGESWERGPYYVDGLLPLAYQLDDPALKTITQKFMDWTLTHQAPSGMFGPASNDDWWPRMVMLKALTQYQEATGDPRVVPLMQRYFAYQLRTLPTRPLRDWGKFRWQDNVLSVLWLYDRNADPDLLKLARLLHAQGFDWQADFANFKYTQRITPEFIKLNEGQGLSDTALATHGVNNGQAFKAAPVWSTVTGAAQDRAGFAQMQEALDTYHGLPNGMFSCDEHLAGRNPSQGSELCTVVETMFSLEQSLAILGDASIGDRLEQLAFNALPGAFTNDMWAHQYNQEPNQVEVSLHREPWTTDGPESNIYGLAPNFGCCTANYHQGWPKFTASLWMATHDDGLAAAAYAPCSVQTVVRGVPVALTQETEYPFRETIHIRVEPVARVRFPMRLRIPAWATGASITVNGKAETAPAPGGFATVDRTWQAGDAIELRLPMTAATRRGFNHSVSVECGPLVFSYAIGGDWLKLRDRGPASDWQVFPTSEWNYALRATPSTLRVEEAPFATAPFTLDAPGVVLHTEAHRLPDWRAEDGVAAVVPKGPVVATTPSEPIQLVPYAAAKLRITAFPEAQA